LKYVDNLILFLVTTFHRKITSNKFLYDANKNITTIIAVFHDLARLDEFKNPGSGFIVNDTYTIEVGIFVTKH